VLHFGQVGSTISPGIAHGSPDVERPGGGLSIVLADGQQSGKSAKKISNLVVRKVISLLAEGVRDGAAARAASDALYHEKGGKVQASLNILSVDLTSRTVVITRNNPSPVYFLQEHMPGVIDEASNPVGLYRNTRPSIRELRLDMGLSVLAFTDGLANAGDRYGKCMELPEVFLGLCSAAGNTAQIIADSLLDLALEREQGRPGDDISLVILRVEAGEDDHIRRLNLRLPLQ
jgi:serine phosphatase RsbU (regulator of sigma subunit)